MAGKGEIPKFFGDDKVVEHVHKRAESLKNVSPQFMRDRAEVRSKIAQTHLEERKSQHQEGSKLLAWAVAPMIMKGSATLSPDDESNCLNEEEKEIYFYTINQVINDKDASPEDQDALRLKMTEVIFRPSVYLAHFKVWKENYRTSPFLQKQYPDINDFYLKKGIDFIKKQRDWIILSRLGKFQNDSIPKAPSEVKQNARLKEIQEKTLKFVEENESNLLAYSKPDSGDRKEDALFEKFVHDVGLQNAPLDSARELFEKIVDDIKFAFYVEKKFKVVNQLMVQEADKADESGTEIDEADWDDKLAEKLGQDKAFKRAIQISQVAVPQQASVVETATKSPIESVQAVAMQAGGLSVVSYNSITDTYIVRYPDSNLKIPMKLVTDSDANSEHAKFMFFSKNVDREKGNEVSFSRERLRYGSNQMYLDYLMNDWLRKNKSSPNFDPNEILHDDEMMQLATGVLGHDLKDVVLTRDMRTTFKSFLEILMKPDKSDSTFGNLASFKARVEIMKRVINKPQYLDALREELNKPSSSELKLSELLDLIKYKE